MKIIIFTFAICAILALASASDVSDPVEYLRSMEGQPQKEIFKAFHFLYKKQYDLNTQEAVQRYRNFKDNMAYIRMRNKELNTQLLGPTEFIDMTHQEYIDKMLVRPEILEQQIEENHPFLNEDHHDDPDVDPIVRRYDEPIVRRDDDTDPIVTGDINYMQWEGPIKNQGSCGSCWAFAALGAVENAYFKIKGKYTSFSEQYIVDCNSRRYGCKGGTSDSVFSWMTSNGVTTTQVLPYTARQGTCNTTLKNKEYKIVKGFKRYQKKYCKYGSKYCATSSLEELIRQGPAAVYMDASSRDFKMYRPGNTFSAIENPNCPRVTHAVVAVAIVTENGKKYIICRNSWGKNWGYKGYFKFPYDKNCQIENFAYLPVVYDGHSPDNDDNKPNPKPEPKEQDCVQVFTFWGFGYYGDKKICDSLPNTGTNYIEVGGIKFPEKKINPVLAVRLFEYQQCWGAGNDYTDSVRVTSTTEFPHKTMQGNEQKQSWSLAFEKKAYKGCVDFYENSCHQGKPMMSICNNIHDSTGVNIRDIVKTKSINWNDDEIAYITFYDQPNYQGNSQSLSGSTPIYQIGTKWSVGEMLVDGKVRSVKVIKK